MTKELEKRVADLENRVSALEKTSHISSSPRAEKKRRVSVNEFLREKKPTNAINKILTIAVYVERILEADSFNAKDLLDLIRKAKERKPTNINDLINKNIKKGYIAADDKSDEHGKKRWYVTNTGIDFVDNNFNDKQQNT